MQNIVDLWRRRPVELCCALSVCCCWNLPITLPKGCWLGTEQQAARGERSRAKDSADQPHLSPEVEQYPGSYSIPCDRQEEAQSVITTVVSARPSPGNRKNGMKWFSQHLQASLKICLNGNWVLSLQTETSLSWKWTRNSSRVVSFFSLDVLLTQYNATVSYTSSQL